MATQSFQDAHAQLYNKPLPSASGTSSSSGVSLFQTVHNQLIQSQANKPKPVSTPVVNRPIDTTEQPAQQPNLLQSVKNEGSSLIGGAEKIASGIFGAAKSIAKQVVDFVPKAPAYVGSAITNPVDTVGGAGSAVINAFGSLAGLVENGIASVAHVTIPDQYNVSKQLQAFNGINNLNLQQKGVSQQQAFATGNFIGSFLPYALAGEVSAASIGEKVLLPTAEKFLPGAIEAIPTINNAIGFLGVGQIEHTPEDGTRVDQFRNDLIMLSMFEIGGVAIKGLSSHTKDLISETVNSVKGKSKVDMEAVQPKVQEVKDAIQKDTGKPAASLLAQEIADGKVQETESIKPTEEPIDTKMSPFDSPEVIKARAEQESIPHTSTINTPERDVLRSAIADKLYENGGYADPAKRQSTEIKSEKRADIVIGAPASGKSSTVVDPLVKEHSSMLIDNDEGKKLIPESNGGKNANAVHEESSDIVDSKLLEKAITKGNNVVTSIVGKNPDKLRNLAKHLHALGYNVHLHLSDVTPETAAQRGIQRFNKTGRFVDPAYIYHDVGLKPTQNYDTMKQEGHYDSYTKHNNEGTESKKVEYVTNDEATRRSNGRQSTSNPAKSTSKPKTKASVKPQTGEPTNQQPVGTGKLRESTAYKRLVQNLEKENPEAASKLGEAVTYNRVNLQDQALKAIKLIEENPQKALDIAKGYENPPDGMLRRPIVLALADRAREEKNWKLFADLESHGSLTQTRLGQEIVVDRGRFNDNSTHSSVNQVLNARLTALGKSSITEGLDMARKMVGKTVSSAKRNAVDKIDKATVKLQKELKQRQVRIQSAQGLLDQLTCK